MGNYLSVKKWREKDPKNLAYHANFMSERRHYFKNLWLKKKIKFFDIPVAYRPKNEWKR